MLKAQHTVCFRTEVLVMLLSYTSHVLCSHRQASTPVIGSGFWEISIPGRLCTAFCKVLVQCHLCMLAWCSQRERERDSGASLLWSPCWAKDCTLPQIAHKVKNKSTFYKNRNVILSLWLSRSTGFFGGYILALDDTALNMVEARHKLTLFCNANGCFRSMLSTWGQPNNVSTQMNYNMRTSSPCSTFCCCCWYSHVFFMLDILLYFVFCPAFIMHSNKKIVPHLLYNEHIQHLWFSHFSTFNNFFFPHRWFHICFNAARIQKGKTLYYLHAQNLEGGETELSEGKNCNIWCPKVWPSKGFPVIQSG